MKLKLMTSVVAVFAIACGDDGQAPAHDAAPEPDTGTSPVAADDSFELDEDSAFTVAAAQGVLANDVSDAGALVAVLDTPPAHGTVVLQPDGGFSYTPAANYAGTDELTYHATVDGQSSAIARVALVIRPVADAPIANSDSFAVDEDTTLGVAVADSVLDNDTDVDGDTLVAQLVTDVSHGVLTLAADGSFSYQPDPNYFGTDSFVYAADDGALSSMETVSIEVRSVNDQPVTTAVASVATAEDTSIVIALTGTDVEDVASTLTAAITTSPQYGTLNAVTGASPPAVRYTPNPNYSGSDSFAFTVTDSAQLASVAQTIALTVSPVNDAPVAIGDLAWTYLGASVDIPVLGNDTDVDSPSLSVMSATLPAHGATTVIGTMVRYAPAAGYDGPDAFSYTIVDDAGATSTAQVTVTVGPGCCDTFAGCNGVCENDLGPLVTAGLPSSTVAVIDDAPRAAHAIIDTSPVTGSQLTVYYDTYQGSWSSEVAGVVDLPFEVFRTRVMRVFVDNGEPLLFLEASDIYSQGDRAVLLIARVGGVWQPPVSIINAFVNSSSYDMMLDASFARIAGERTIVFYAIVKSAFTYPRYTYVTRETGGVWSTPARITSIDQNGWAPFLYERNGRASIIHGSSTIAWTNQSASGTWSTTDLTTTLGLTTMTRRGDASVNAGSTIIAPDGNVAFVYTDGTTGYGERIRYAHHTGTAWELETVLDVGAASTNGTVSLGTPQLAYVDNATPIVVYDRFTQSPIQASVGLARRGVGWTTKDILGPNVTAVAMVPVGVGYVFLETSAVPTATGNSNWHYGYAYLCAGPQCPAGACTDGLHNGLETDVDCGGAVCGTCSAADTCLGNYDCASATCTTSSVCGP